MIARRSVPMVAWFLMGPLSVVALAAAAIGFWGPLVPVPASAETCPASIDETITVAEVGGREFAPSEFDRAFPAVPGLLAPGDSGGDELSVRSIAEAPVTVTLIVESRQTPVEDVDHDLRVTVTWAGTVAATGTYSQIVGQRVPLGTIEPRDRAVLRVDVELPAVDEEDNDTQEKEWPLRFDLGVQADGECAGDRTDDRADSDADGAGGPEGHTSGEDTAAQASSSGDDDGDGGEHGDERAADADANGAGANSADESGGQPAHPDDRALPRTGVEGLGIIALTAFVLAFAGFLLVAAGRRRRPSGAEHDAPGAGTSRPSTAGPGAGPGTNRPGTAPTKPTDPEEDRR